MIRAFYTHREGGFGGIRCAVVDWDDDIRHVLAIGQEFDNGDIRMVPSHTGWTAESVPGFISHGLWVLDSWDRIDDYPTMPIKSRHLQSANRKRIPLPDARHQSSAP